MNSHIAWLQCELIVWIMVLENNNDIQNILLHTYSDLNLLEKHVKVVTPTYPSLPKNVKKKDHHSTKLSVEIHGFEKWLLKSPTDIGKHTLWKSLTNINTHTHHTMLHNLLYNFIFIVCKWYLHHGIVCFLMVLATPKSSGSGSKLDLP